MCLFLLTAIFAHTLSRYFFQLLPLHFCHALCTSDVPFLRTSVIPLASQLVLARLMAGLYFLPGDKEAGHAFCSSAPFGSTGSPGNPHTPVLRAVGTHYDLRCRKVQ